MTDKTIQLESKRIPGKDYDACIVSNELGDTLIMVSRHVSLDDED